MEKKSITDELTGIIKERKEITIELYDFVFDELVDYAKQKNTTVEVVAGMILGAWALSKPS